MQTEALEIKGIFDSHCHYDDHAFDDDRDELLDDILGEGSAVEYLMHACTDFSSAEFGIRTSERYERFYTSVGIHPENITDDMPEDYIGRLRRLCLENSKVRAIGEIGLDYHYDDCAERSVQIEVFENQLLLAKELGLPVIIHCRDATEDLMMLMHKLKPEGVVHCFSGSAETASELLKLGLYIGFTGVLSFKNAKKARKAFAVVPEDRLLFETDCPYMAPEPFRGKRCDSRMIANLSAAAEQFSDKTAQQLIDMTNKNAKRLFKIE